MIYRAAAFLLAFSGTVVASLSLGSLLWPEGIGNEAEIIFWPATGVALFFALKYGPGYIPLILLSALPAVIFADDPRIQAVLGAVGNVFEVLIGWWILTRFGRYSGHFETIRVVVALIVASLLGGVASALYPIHQFLTGVTTGEAWQGTVLRFAFANGCGTMIVCVFLNSVASGRWRFLEKKAEFAVWLGVSLAVVSVAFNAVFRNEINHAFLVYPLVIFAAVRYGTSECSAALLLVILGIYVALVRDGAQMEEDEVLPIIQFIQAFTWVLGATGLFVAALTAERRDAQTAMLAEKDRLLESELGKERARLESLRYQINPHFLFNSINSISASLPDVTDRTGTMLAELSDYLRSVLDHPAGDYSPVRTELDSIRQYVAIERQRHGDELEFAVNVEPRWLDRPIPVFLLQPLVENAIRHGFESGTGRVRVEINVRSEDPAWLQLEVRNTGHWVDPGTRQGLGLKNIRRRLDLLYDGRARLESASGEGCVTVRISIPLGSNPPQIHDEDASAR